MKSQLSVAITTASGEVYRWGPDEWDAQNIPQALAFGTSMPGGFKSATLTLPRRIDLDYPDLNLLDSVQILGPGNEVAWEGRVQQLPRTHQDTFSIQVGAVGWSAHLMDDPSFREIYVGRGLGEWTEISTAHRIGFGTSYAYAGFSVAPDSSEARPSILLEVNGHWEGQIPVAGCIYDAGPGLGIAFMDHEWVVSNTDPKWIFQPWEGSDDKPTGFTSLGDFAGGGASGSGTITTAGGRVFGFQWYYETGGAGADGAQYRASLRHLAWFGKHGLPIRGSAPNRGLYASDVIADVLSRVAPLLNYSTGESGSIQPTTFVIPHLVFREQTTAQAVIMQTNGYHLWDWGVWENREFFFHEPSSERLTWEARLSDGARLDLEGSQADDVYNGAYVQYADPAGVNRTVGPPGASADATDASLADTSESNPVNAHGIPRRWALLNLSQTTTQAGAIQLGATYLGEKSLPQRRGSLTLTGSIGHPAGGTRPVWSVRAGDWVRISDHPTDVPRKIIETNYDAPTDTLTCSLDNTSQKLDAILERLGVSLMGVL
jgi:hypothetical protein